MFHIATCEFSEELFFKAPITNCYFKLLFQLALGAFNPFVSNAPFLYPLKTSDNLTVSSKKGRERLH